MAATGSPDAAPEAAPAVETADKAAWLREAIARDYERLCRYARKAVKRATNPSSFAELQERVQEVVAEAVRRALERAGSYDPRRPPIPWLWGFIAKVLQELSRHDRRPRPVTESELGEAAWAGALDGLSSQSGADESAREQVQQVRLALAQLRESDRRLLELKFFQNLDTAALARATGAKSEGAVRVAVHRAMRAMRAVVRGPEEQSP